MRGIYEISIDKYVYIGQAEVIERRQRQHLRDLSVGRHDNDFMQRAFDKHGLNPDGWFRVLELVPEGEPLTPRELFWYRTRIAERGRDRVMNIAEPGNAPTGERVVERRRQACQTSAERQRRSVEATAQWQRDGERERRIEAIKGGWSDERRAAQAARIAATRNIVRPGFVGPDGTVYRNVTNLRAFSREHGLNNSMTSEMARGGRRQHKGWTRYEEDTDA